MKHNKKYRIAPVAATALAGLVLGMPAVAKAQQGINVTVDGDVVNFNGQQPMQQLGTVLVPLRGVFERLGANVAYDGATKTILAVKGATSVRLRIGESQAIVNGQTRVLSLPAQAVNGATLVPLRFVSEALGADVKWRGASRTVVISTIGTASSAAAAVTPGADGTPAAVGTAAARAEVSSLTHSASGALRAGEAVTVTLQGTPGGAASFSIPGIDTARDIAMRENTPGTYVGTFAVPAGVNVKGATVFASLKVGSAASPVVQSGQPLTVDAVGPTLGSLSPAQNAALAPGKPLLYGTMSDAGTGVSAANTRLLVNGKDVTAQATITEAFFSYRPEADLPLGKNVATVVARDAAGNETRKDWSFTVSADEALLREVTFTPNTKALEPGDVLNIQATGQPGGRATFSLGGNVTGRPMTEQSPGVYVGTYTVRKGDSLAEAPVAVNFTSAAGRTVTQSASSAVTIAAGAPVKPVITSPQAGAAAGEAVTLTGTAAPNATVRYHVRYQGTLIILPAAGTVAEGEVKADAQGRWSVPNVRLASPAGVSRLSYTVDVEAVGAAGEVSEPTSVTFKR